MAYPNYGLMADMASGIKEGMIAYQTNQQIQRQNQLQDLTMGVQRDPDSGLLQYTPQKQQQIALQQKQTQRQSDAMDPTSQYSQNQRQLYKGILGPQASSAITDDMSANDLEQNSGLLKAKMTADETRDWRTMMMQNKSGLQENKDVSGERKAMLNDPDYKTASNNLLEGNRALDAIEQAKAGNPIASGALPIMLAKFQSGLKRINTKEIQAMGGSKALDQRVQQIFTEAKSGTMTPENLSFMEQMVNHTMDSDHQSLESVKQRHAQYLASDKGMDASDAYQKLNGQPMAAQGKGLLGGAGQGTNSENYSPDVLSYAQTHGISPQQAQAIKMKRTGGQ